MPPPAAAQGGHPCCVQAGETGIVELRNSLQQLMMIQSSVSLICTMTVFRLVDDGEWTHILWAEWWFDGVDEDVDKLEVQDPGGS